MEIPPLASSGPFGDDYSHLNDAAKREQDGRPDQSAKEPVEVRVDLAGSGLEALRGHRFAINQEWNILHHQWRSFVEHNETTIRHIGAFEALFSPDSIIAGHNIGDQIILDYGKYHLSDRSVREDMVRNRAIFATPLLAALLMAL